MRCTIIVSLLALITCIGCSRSKPTPEQAPRPQQTQAERSVSDVAHESLKSVVTIVTADATGRSLEQGSGFIVTTDGKVVTNYHVIAGAASAVAKLEDGGIYEVQGIVGSDRDKDLAVLKLRASEREFAPLRRADSGQIKAGDAVIAIGSPLGLEGTVSTGVISAKRTMPGTQIEILQITTPISPGSSGGALLNSKGEVVGVPFIQMVDGQNLNFAIPITYVSALIVDVPPKPFASVSEPSVAKKTPPKRSSPPSSVTKQAPQVVQTSTLDPSELNGTYTGMWQSTVYAASGAAVMTVTTNGKMVRADIALTGGEVTRDILVGEVSEVGGGWSITFRNAAGNLYATGIFKKGVFEGDYDYVSASDHGRWGLKKD